MLSRASADDGKSVERSRILPGIMASLPRRSPRLAVVVPCHNETDVLPETVRRLRDLLSRLRSSGMVHPESYVCFVDDGSGDATWAVIVQATVEYGDVRGLKLSRNFGHQGAVLAGMLECEADAVVTIDADLQDDENCIAEMVEKYASGCEVVVGVRNDRSIDSLFKRWTAEIYYRILNRLGVKVVFNHADYRLMSSAAIAKFKSFGETNVFLRGLVPLVGLPSSIVEYSRRERFAGTSKYPLNKMLALAWEGITSFSLKPLRLVSALGAMVSVGALLVTIWALYTRFFGRGVVPGWASTVVPMYFLGGIQILCLGVIGEYIGKIYLETKKRPRYLIETRTWE